MKHCIPTLLLLAPLPLAFAATAQGAATVQEAASSSEFGEPLVVNGVLIPDLEIKRALVYGPGRNAVEARKLQILMDHERELRRVDEREQVLAEMAEPDTSGMPDQLAAATREKWEAEVAAEVDRRMARYEIDPDAVTERLEKERESFYERYPMLDHEVELARAYTSASWYRAQVAQTMRFDQLFFPDHPDTWPALSIEAIHAGSPEVDLIADYAREYERRKAEAEANNTRIVPEQEMMMALLRDFVMGALWSLAEIRTATHGIPAHLVMTIDGGDWVAEIETEDVYQEMKHVFSEQNVADAKLFLALMEATRQRLDKEGRLMAEEDFQQMVTDLDEQMQNTMFNMEFLALQGHGFPSPEAYKQHLKYVESMRRSLGDSLELDEQGQLPQPLLDHMPVANGIMGLARAHADLLLVSAFDFPNFKWKEDGWSNARERALELRAEIDEYLLRVIADSQAREAAIVAGENYESPEGLLPFDQWWKEYLALNSEYWDPPLPVTGKSPPALGLKNKGAFQGEAMTRNDMKRAIGESEFSHFISNDSIVDRIFFELTPGTVGGPFRGPKGYYIVYLRSRTAPTNPLNVQRERHLKMIQEDWLRKEFQRYAHEALNEAEVAGL